MYLTDEQTIKIKSHLENEARRIINKDMVSVLDVAKKYKDVAVINKDGSILKKLGEEIKPLLNREQEIKQYSQDSKTTIQYYFLNHSNYNLWIDISLNIVGGSYETKDYYCLYWQKTLYVADLDNRILKVVSEHKTQEQINADEQINLLNEAKSKQEEYKQAKDKLFYPFKELLRDY